METYLTLSIIFGIICWWIAGRLTWILAIKANFCPSYKNYFSIKEFIIRGLTGLDSDDIFFETVFTFFWPAILLMSLISLLCKYFTFLGNKLEENNSITKNKLKVSAGWDKLWDVLNYKI